MATPNQKLAESLEQLKLLQKDGRRVFQSEELSRVHRERLLANNFLQVIMKGWLLSSSPGAGKGDSTAWYASFWEFCAQYCDARFGADWHLSPELSLLLHAESTVVPDQVIIYSPKGTHNKVDLLFETSLYDLKQKAMPPRGELEVRDGLRLYARPVALTKVPESFFAQNPIEARVLLAGLEDTSELLARLLDGGHSVVAGRLAGAFRSLGRDDFADHILSTMKAAGYDLRETDPFQSRQSFHVKGASVSPAALRMQAIWESLREAVIGEFPEAPGRPGDPDAYMRRIDGVYQNDAYHSLSIEGYHVTPELVDRVRTGAWNPEDHDEDRRNRDALAARGYWQAFEKVRETVAQILAGGEPGALVRAAHQGWYREMFQPSVAAGLVAPSALAGYRNDAVFLRGSRYIPPRPAVVPQAMLALFDQLEQEPDTAVRAVLGHWMLGYIHPYVDGNGRMARFLMNAMLASGGYAWTIIRVDDRARYMSALESASIDMDIVPFTRFVAERVHVSAAG